MKSRLNLLRSGLITPILLMTGCIAAGPKTEMLPRGEPGIAFPEVNGVNLEGEEVPLPGGFEGERNLVAVAFKRQQQAMVDTWIAEFDGLVATYPELRFYELPTIYEANALVRLWINNGMRSGTPDPIARERTITLYLDRQKFVDELQISTMSDIHLFLLDDRGTVLWRTAGAADSSKMASLEQALR